MWPPVTHLVISEISLPETLADSSGKKYLTPSVEKWHQWPQWPRTQQQDTAWQRCSLAVASQQIESWYFKFWSSKFYLLWDWHPGILSFEIPSSTFSWECSWPGVMLSVIQSTTPFSSYFGLLLARSSRYVGMGQWPLYLLNKCHMNRNVLFYWSGKGYRLYIEQSVGHWL